MQQSYLCPSCTAQVTWGDTYCRRCGAWLDWKFQQTAGATHPTEMLTAIHHRTGHSRKIHITSITPINNPGINTAPYPASLHTVNLGTHYPQQNWGQQEGARNDAPNQYSDNTAMTYRDVRERSGQSYPS